MVDQSSTEFRNPEGPTLALYLNMVDHISIFNLVVLFARSSRLIPDKANLGFCFPCDEPGSHSSCLPLSPDFTLSTLKESGMPLSPSPSVACKA
ncbi:hypothetical protein BC332_13515 [Capsicum chinense]|nr:hypothetical protein BC332_13515 [Capsicum chinense]